jgi:hypothetical protein
MRVRILDLKNEFEVAEEISRFGEIDRNFSSEVVLEKLLDVNFKIEGVSDDIASFVSSEVARHLNGDVFVSTARENGRRDLMVSMKRENLRYLLKHFEQFFR